MRGARRPTSAAAILAAAVLAGCGGAGDTPEPGPARAREAPSAAGLPPSLAANVRQADTIVGEGEQVFQARLADLRGTPVVVNQWASWCGTCRFEFPFFARATRTFRASVAFLGLDARDQRDAAEAFLREFPTGFPSVFDRDASIARSLGGGTSWPTTFYLDRRGAVVYTRIGAYSSFNDLQDDIRRYALAGAR